MSSADPAPKPTEAFDDVLAKMMQAEVNEGGSSPAAPCDTPVEIISHIHMATPKHPVPEDDDTVRFTHKELEQTLTENLDRLRKEIHQIQANSATFTEAAKDQWNRTLTDLDAKQTAAREKLGEVASSTGEAWEHLWDVAKIAWNELERAVRKARSEF